MKGNSLGINRATNFTETPVERRPRSGAANTSFIPDPPYVRTRITKNGGPWLELVNKRKPTLKEIIHVLLPFSFCPIQKNVLYLSIPGLNAQIIKPMNEMLISIKETEILQDHRKDKNSIRPTKPVNNINSMMVRIKNSLRKKAPLKHV